MTEFLTVVPGEVKTKELHGLLLGAVSPRPIAFASTISPDGVPNLAPFSFFNVFGSNPPIAIFSPARRVRDNTTKHTLENIIRVPEVVINVVSHEMVGQMILASAEFGEGINEFSKAGFTEIASDLIRPPRVLEAPVQMECKVIELKPLADHGGAGNLIICKVLKMHINKAVLNESGKIDPHKIDLVGRMGANYYVRASGEAVFEVENPRLNPIMGIDDMPESIRNSTVLTGNDLGKLANVERVPTKEEVLAFSEDEKGLIGELGNRENIHKKAQEYLLKNEKVLAWKLLLLSDQD